MRLMTCGWVLFSLAALAQDPAQDRPQGREPPSPTEQMLTNDVAKLEILIRDAQDDLIEYRRLHDSDRVDAKAKADLQELDRLVEKRASLLTQVSILTNQTTELSAEMKGVERAIAQWNPKNVFDASRRSELHRLQRKVQFYKDVYERVCLRLLQLRLAGSLESWTSIMATNSLPVGSSEASPAAAPGGRR